MPILCPGPGEALKIQNERTYPLSNIEDFPSIKNILSMDFALAEGVPASLPLSDEEPIPGRSVYEAYLSYPRQCIQGANTA